MFSKIDLAYNRDGILNEWFKFLTRDVKSANKKFGLIKYAQSSNLTCSYTWSFETKNKIVEKVMFFFNLLFDIHDFFWFVLSFQNRQFFTSSK